MLFYSLYGHTYELAKAVAEGAQSIPGVNVTLMQVPEKIPDKVINQTGAQDTKDQMKDVKVASPQMLKDFDAIIVGTPTRFGSMCFQMRAFWDFTGNLWKKGALVGKVGSVFTTTSTQHGGQEATIQSTWTTFAHHGMIIVPIGYQDQELYDTNEVIGGSPYGAGAVSGSDGSRAISEYEMRIAKNQGKYVATVTRDLMNGRKLNN